MEYVLRLTRRWKRVIMLTELLRSRGPQIQPSCQPQAPVVGTCLHLSHRWPHHLLDFLRPPEVEQREWLRGDCRGDKIAFSLSEAARSKGGWEDWLRRQEVSTFKGVRSSKSQEMDNAWLGQESFGFSRNVCASRVSAKWSRSGFICSTFSSTTGYAK